MSGLSAKVSGSSGEGVRIRGGGTGISGTRAPFLVFLPLAFRNIGASFSSPLEGADESADESESDMMKLLRRGDAIAVLLIESACRDVQCS